MKLLLQGSQTELSLPRKGQLWQVSALPTQGKDLGQAQSQPSVSPFFLQLLLLHLLSAEWVLGPRFTAAGMSPGRGRGAGIQKPRFHVFALYFRRSPFRTLCRLHEGTLRAKHTGIHRLNILRGSQLLNRNSEIQNPVNVTARSRTYRPQTEGALTSPGGPEAEVLPSFSPQTY